MATKKRSNPIGTDSDWRAESDLATLMQAEAIKRDPKRLAAAQAIAKEKLTQVAAVAGQAPSSDK